MFFPSPLSLSSLFSLPSFLPLFPPPRSAPPNRAQRFGRAVFSPSRGERHLQPPDTFSRARSRKHYIMALMQQGASALIRQIITFSQHGGDGAKCRRQLTATKHRFGTSAVAGPRSKEDRSGHGVIKTVISGRLVEPGAGV